MKKNKKKGFTLIELLAVIVILAILATAAFTLILPRINEGRKKSFTSEIGDIIKSVELYCTEHDCPNGTEVTVSTLIDGGYLQKQGVTSNYGGVVKIEATVDNFRTTYKYHIAFRNENFKVGGNKNCVEYKNVTIDAISEAKDTTTDPVATTCS